VRSHGECLAKAVEMDGRARTCCPSVAAQYARMAVRWRQLAKQAAWQDGFPSLKDEN
jgi:aerobic-type carbon monoxide dehydrogenase small subunit (CoxS/CutS family)